MARLNYHHLYYFWRVATDGNLTRVAKSLHVSQSALSTQIKNLEDHAGMSLFKRTGRTLVLTEDGRRVLDYANDIFARGEELEAWLKTGGVSAQEPLRIGIISTLSRNFINRLIAPALAKGEIKVVLEAQTADSLVDKLSRHLIDVALTNGAFIAPTNQLWQRQLLARQRVAIIGPVGFVPDGDFPHGYSGRKWVVPEKDSEIRHGFEAFCRQYGYSPNIIAEANDMPMLRLLARDAKALSVLPPVVVADEIKRGMLAEYTTLPNVHESFYAITTKRRHYPPALKTMLDAFDGI